MVWIVCGYYHFIIRESCVNKAATHLGSAVFYKEMVAVIAQCDLVFVCRNCSFQEIKRLARNDERICFWTFYIGSFEANQSMRIGSNALHTLFVQFEKHTSHRRTQIIIAGSKKRFVYCRHQC